MTADTLHVVGWDIGGVNTKAAHVVWTDGSAQVVQVAVEPFEIWRDPIRLAAVLRDVAERFALADAYVMALTMTAELSDAFACKRDGVLTVLDAVREAFPGADARALSINGEFVSNEVARARPLDLAATNWLASALYVAQYHPDCLLVDVGSTTTDIIPISGGRVQNEGRDDTGRLGSGELLYTGVLRSEPQSLTDVVPVRGRMTRVAAEHFALMADVYLLLGKLSAADYTCPTADGRGTTPGEAAGRLARLVCADLEMLAEPDVVQMARYLMECQLHRIGDGVLQVLSRLPDGASRSVVPAGAGAFLAEEAARRLDMRTAAVLSEQTAQAVALPAAAVACLLAQDLGGHA